MPGFVLRLSSSTDSGLREHSTLAQAGLGQRCLLVLFLCTPHCDMPSDVTDTRDTTARPAPPFVPAPAQPLGMAPGSQSPDTHKMQTHRFWNGPPGLSFTKQDKAPTKPCQIYNWMMRSRDTLLLDVPCEEMGLVPLVLSPGLVGVLVGPLLQGSKFDTRPQV